MKRAKNMFYKNDFFGLRNFSTCAKLAGTHFLGTIFREGEGPPTCVSVNIIRVTSVLKPPVNKALLVAELYTLFPPEDAEYLNFA